MQALAMMTVSDVIDPDAGNVERISDEDLKKGVDQMMRIACQVAISSTNEAEVANSVTLFG